MKIPPLELPESWAHRSTSERIEKDGELVGIRVKTLTETFTVPVLKSVKGNPVSRFFPQSYSWYGPSYNQSMKRV